MNKEHKYKDKYEYKDDDKDKDAKRITETPCVLYCWNDHLDQPASCKWFSGSTCLLQMIIRMAQPLANDHLEGLGSCKWLSGSSGLLQMILLFLLCCSSPPQKNISSSTVNLLLRKKHILRLQIYSSFSFPGLLHLWNNIFSISKFNLPFPSPFYSSSAKKRIPSLNTILFFLLCSSSPPKTQNSKF